MKKIIFLGLALLCATASYADVTGVVTPPGGAGGGALSPIPTGTILGAPCTTGNCVPSALPTGLLSIFDVRAYGAKCDGVTDDSTAWQNAINAAAAALQSLTYNKTLLAKLSGCGEGLSYVATTLNFTGFHTTAGGPQAIGFQVDMTGSCILGGTNGTPVIDALGSRFIEWKNLCVWGAATNTPSIGIQIGRTSTAVSADDMIFHHPVIDGNFTTAAFYNNASEDLTVDGGWDIQNQTGPYAVVQDGYDHFAITSAYVSTSGLTADVYESFNDTRFIGSGTVSCLGSSCYPFWIGGSANHRYSGYAHSANTGASSAGALLYEEAARPAVGLMFDMHFEAALSGTLDYDFIVQSNTGGPALPTPVFNDFTYINNGDNAATSSFGISTNVTSATLAYSTVKIGRINNSGKLFDTNANWTFGGSVYLPSSTPWNGGPSSFAGILCDLTCSTTSSGWATNVGFTVGSVAQAITNYLAPGNGALTTKGAAAIATYSGTLKNLYVSVANAPASTQTYTFTVYAGTPPISATLITCTISNPATTCNDTADTATITAGQLYDVQVVTSSTSGSTGQMALGLEFTQP